MATMASRNLILSRRAGGIGNLEEITLENGELTVDQVIQNGIYKVNCTHQVGIATATEVGLSYDRYPIRVVITDNATTFLPNANNMCVSYWRVVDAANNAVGFARKPIASEQCIVNLYDRVRDLDERLWAAYEAMNYTVIAPVMQNDINAVVERLYGNLCVPAPTAVQLEATINDVAAIITHFQGAGMAPRFKVAENVYVIGEPHGRVYTAAGGLSADVVATHETLLCAKINRDRIAARPDNVNLKPGLYTLGGMCVAAMFRNGLFESFEHQEYYTIICTPTANVAGSYTVASIRAPTGAPALTSIAVGSNHTVTGIKVSQKICELANSMVVNSGLMHYLFNHTTGGQSITGVLLSTLAMYNFCSSNTTHEDMVKITNVIYESLHPSNKRAVANIFFSNSRVISHGRCQTAPKYGRFELDSFMALRTNPHPAGSHKAAMCMLGLRRVAQSGLLPFLPWVEQINGCVTLCEDVLNNGARSHIGSAYYTGEPPLVQSSSLDQYLPEIAMYIHTFNKGDSLSMSPHLSAETAKRAAMNWQNLLKEIKAKDVSATPAEKVREFLASTGGAYYNFDPEDNTSWANAAQNAKAILGRIDRILT
nr:hypothetical protein [Qingdao RNA virus 4]